MSLWENIENKYFQKTANIKDPHWFISTRNNITPEYILHVHSKMTNQGITKDS